MCVHGRKIQTKLDLLKNYFPDTFFLEGISQVHQCNVTLLMFRYFQND